MTATPRPSEEPLLGMLGRFAAGIGTAPLPGSVIRQAQLSILDTIGCIVAGSNDPDALRLAQSELGHAAPGRSSAVGHGRRLSAEAAARVNGYMGDVLELNDFTGGHAGISNVTAALAFSEELGASGEALLHAVVAGIETTARVYAGFYGGIKPFTEVAMLPISIPATLGVAAMAAHLLKLDASRSAQAMAIAGTLAGWNPAEIAFGPSGSIKPIVFGGWTSTVGIMAARYAAAGMTGPLAVLESPFGYYNTVSRRIDRDAMRTQGLWYLDSPRRKLHACCGFLHSAVESAVRLRGQGADVRGARQIQVRLPKYIATAFNRSALPETATEARFDVRYCVALALIEADTIAVEHSGAFRSYLARTDIRDTMAKISVVDDPAMNHFFQSGIRLLDADGDETRSSSCTAPRGTPDNPLDDDAVISKFRQLVAGRLDGSAAEAYVSRLLDLERAHATDWLLEPFHRTRGGEAPAVRITS